MIKKFLERLLQRIFCHPRTIAEARDQQPDWNGIVLTEATAKDKAKNTMKTFTVIFVALCAIVAGSITESVFDALTYAGCDDELAEYRAEHAETLRELKKLEKFVGGWGTTKPGD